jgi:RHS repeat-associated protein
VTSSTNPDGTTYTQYWGRTVLSTDVNGVRNIVSHDLLGRIADICEVSSSNLQGDSPQPCPGDIGGYTGFVTHYTYDLANNKTTVTQGAQQRVFQTDPAGRTVYTSEPERGVTNYSYLYNSTGLQVTRTRPRANQTNPTVTTSTVTQYDSLGRVLTITYSDGTPTKQFDYDTVNSALQWTQTPTNIKGMMADMASGSGASLTRGLFSYDIMGNVTTMWQCAPSICGTSAQASRPALTFGYDYVGNLVSEGDGASGNIAYGRSPAGEVTSITNQTYTDQYNTPNLVSNVVNSPNGPTSYQLGNGLSVNRQYDAMGRLYGGWVCSGTVQPNCAGGTQTYGFTANQSGARVTAVNDTALNQHIDFGYDEFNRLSSANIWSGQQTFSYVYDRYGNRWQQNAPQGGPQTSYSFNTATNQNTSLSYDAAGNVTSDGFHSYTYDAEGNILQVDGGNTAQYVYDALNRRVRVQTASSTYEYLFDYAGRRISSWLEPNNFGNEGRIYWGNQQIAYRAWGGTTLFDHQDWMGTERMRTNYTGAISSTYVSLPWGDGYTPNENDPEGNAQDNLHYAMLDHDSESSTEHAQFRQYSSTQGRWMSPDPYDGSYDPNNPGSNNRYSYVMNRPLSEVDPSGLYTNGLKANPVPDPGYSYIDFFWGGLPGFFGGGGSGTTKAPKKYPKLTKQQCQALQTVLNREAQYGTGAAARMSSVTYGDNTLGPFNSTDNPNLQTPVGQLDLDWYTDLQGVNFLNAANPLGTAIAYVGLKSFWTVARGVAGMPIGNYAPFSDPGEQTAVFQTTLGSSYSSIFTPQYMSQVCGK